MEIENSYLASITVMILLSLELSINANISGQEHNGKQSLQSKSVFPQRFIILEFTAGENDFTVEKYPSFRWMSPEFRWANPLIYPRVNAHFLGVLPR